MTICPVASSVALLLVNVNGQFTPPWPTSPLAVQLIVFPLNVPEPDPVTVMLPAHVAVNDTFAVDVPVGVTVYFRLPQPVGGVDGVTEVQEPANASTVVVGVGLGDVGLPVLSFLFSKSQPVVSAHAS